MPVRHLDLRVLERFAAAALRREEMIQAGRHLSSCLPCRVRLRREVRGGARILQRLHLSEQRISTSAEYEEIFDRLSGSASEKVQRIEGEKADAPQLLRTWSEIPLVERPVISRSDLRFHTAAFVEALLESSRNTWSDDPVRAEAFAGLALEIVDCLEPEKYGRGLIKDLQARAWGFIANARRIHSDLRGAEDAFQTAEVNLLDGSGDPLEWARLLDLKASLRRAQRRFEEALKLLDEVVVICRKTHDQHGEGRALIGKALIYDYAGEPEQAVPLLSEALAKVDRSCEPRLTFSILNNLTRCLVGLGEYEKAEALLPEARQAAIEIGTEDDRTRSLWVEGTLDLGTRRLGPAEEKLQTVRDRYVEMGIGYNAALVSLDLAKVYLLQGRTQETKRLAAEMHPIFVSREVQREAIAALLVFQQAAEQETASLHLIDEVIRSVKRAQANPQARLERPA